MKIAVIGTGYVGLVLGCCLADFGNDVICMDKDSKKVEMLNNNILTIYEPGLREVFERNKGKRLFFTDDFKEAVSFAKVIFLALPTPMGKHYEADLSAIKAVARDLGRTIDGYKVIVNKSTVPVGTARLVRKIIKESLEKEADFDVVSNPEFLREGAAVKDFQNPDRTIIGTDSEKAGQIMLSLYKPVARVDKPIILTSPETAEIIKYASNAMLATRISFMNQLSHLCDKTGADIKDVAKGIGLDKRIGPKFLQAGIGYGGSCFPKDVKALIYTLKENGCSASLFEAVDEINEKQKRAVIEKLKEKISVKGSLIAIWGISFKPRTDDIREAPSIVIMQELLKNGAKIRAYDPVAVQSVKKFYPELAGRIYFAADPYDAAENTDSIILVTEWDVFRNLDFEKLKSIVKNPLIIDGRNIYDRKELEGMGFSYSAIGR